MLSILNLKLVSLKTLIIALTSFVVGAGLVIGANYAYKQYQQKSLLFQKHPHQQNNKKGDNSFYEGKRQAQEHASTKTHNAGRDSSQNKNESNQGSNTVTFKGQYITALIPHNWSIIEYTNGAGTDMLTQGVRYTGLTGLAIKNSNGKVVFVLKGVYGIGGAETCPIYYKFPDNNKAYMQQKIAESAKHGVKTLVISVDPNSYSQTTLLGYTLRRVDNIYVPDMIGGNATYESGCGISLHILKFGSIKFTANGRAQHSYEIKIVPGTSDSDMQKLDGILKTIKPV